jgi:hypothetical protein
MQFQFGKSGCLVLLVVGLTVFSAGRSCAQNTGDNGNPVDKWHPALPMQPPDAYVGPKTCAACHRAIFDKQATTEMARSGCRPAELPALLDRSAASYEHGGYTYSIRLDSGKALYTVSDGHDSIAEPLFIAIGANGQVFYFQHQGKFYRAAINYSSSEKKLVLDGEFNKVVPVSLESAFGTPITDESMRSCLRCHSPGTAAANQFDINRFDPGVSCEACHGPGAVHAAAMRNGNAHKDLIFNPAHLGPAEELDFCGDCHHSIQEVKEGKFRGTRTAIPQAYRLAGSRCWNATDQRSRCTFCHDPHAPMMKDTAAYDEKCLACHAGGASTPPRTDQTGKSCPVGKRDCAHCHMPRQATADGVFTDHRIRVVRQGEVYPE